MIDSASLTPTKHLDVHFRVFYFTFIIFCAFNLQMQPLGRAGKNTRFVISAIVILKLSAGVFYCGSEWPSLRE